MFSLRSVLWRLWSAQARVDRPEGVHCHRQAGRHGNCGPRKAWRLSEVGDIYFQMIILFYSEFTFLDSGLVPRVSEETRRKDGGPVPALWAGIFLFRHHPFLHCPRNGPKLRRNRMERRTPAAKSSRRHGPAALRLSSLAARASLISSFLSYPVKHQSSLGLFRFGSVFGFGLWFECRNHSRFV